MFSSKSHKCSIYSWITPNFLFCYITHLSSRHNLSLKNQKKINQQNIVPKEKYKNSMTKTIFFPCYSITDKCKSTSTTSQKYRVCEAATRVENIFLNIFYQHPHTSHTHLYIHISGIYIWNSHTRTQPQYYY